MDILFLNQAQVQQLFSIKEAIPVMTKALMALAQDQAGMPLRSVMSLPHGNGLLGMMPAYVKNPAMMGLKIVSVFPGNVSTEFESHQGVVMLFETTHGRPLAIIEASTITALRTPAVSAVATQILARPEAGDLSLLGSGTQAYGHLEAMLQVRPIRRVRVWSLPLSHAQEFAASASKRWGLPIEAMATCREAVEGADIICTTTPAREPILFGNFIKAGAHINAVGSCSPTHRELDSEAILNSRFYADRRESVLHEAGDFLIPKQEGAVTDDHVLGEIGDILIGKLAGRQSEQEITLFKSLGLAVEDLASAQYIYSQALEKKVGTFIELGGKRNNTNLL